MSEDVKPRIGYVAIEDYTDDYSDWTGQITFPNPKGANIYWQNPIVFIELEPTMRMMDELANKLQVLDDLIGDLSLSPNPESNTIRMEITYDILEKYRKFKEGLK